MKLWGIGINSYNKTANYILDEGSWWVFALEEVNFFVDRIISKLPQFIWEWWWFHIFDPIFFWCNSKRKTWWVDLNYKTIKNKHPERWQEQLKSEKKLRYSNAKRKR